MASAVAQLMCVLRPRFCARTDATCPLNRSRCDEAMKEFEVLNLTAKDSIGMTAAFDDRVGRHPDIASSTKFRVMERWIQSKSTKRGAVQTQARGGRGRPSRHGNDHGAFPHPAHPSAARADQVGECAISSHAQADCDRVRPPGARSGSPPADRRANGRRAQEEADRADALDEVYAWMTSKIDAGVAGKARSEPDRLRRRARWEVG